MTLNRIILQSPGQALTVFRYRREVPYVQAEAKLQAIADTLFEFWDHGDGTIPAIESGEFMLLLVGGPSGREPCL